MGFKLCGFPQGRKAVQALGWCIFAYIFCHQTTMSCNYMRIDGYIVTEASPASPPFVVTGGDSKLGLFGHTTYAGGVIGGDTSTCHRYTSTQLDALGELSYLDSNFHIARIFGIIANVCIGLPLLVTIVSSSVVIPIVVYKVCAVLMWIGGICLALTSLVLNSGIKSPPYNGSLRLMGGIALVAGTILAFVTGITMFIMKSSDTRSTDHTIVVRATKPKKSYTPSVLPGDQVEPLVGQRKFPAPSKRHDVESSLPNAYAPGTETVTETLLPGGKTKKVVTTTIEHDGTKTIKETVMSMLQ